jgi:NADH:ubiquinone oxidoreductase subunit F (NADH-binding)
VIDETIDILETIEMFLEFGIEESCGKCTPCRAGTVRQIELLKLIMSGKASMSDLEELEKLSRMILRSSLCGLGMSTSFPLLSALAHYRDEFTNLIKDGEHHD